jgi:CheY-like chemotaxis protein
VTRLAQGYSIKALIVDDTRLNREVLSRLLVDLGAAVLEAENGAQGVEMVRAHQPDIVFMDIRMPVMGGIEAARQIFSEFGKGTFKIVAISASALQHETQIYLDAGFDDFIGKPFRVERICECLATQLGVAFETAEPATTMASEAVPAVVSLPKELVERMKEAAELYRVTELRKYLAQVEGLGPEGQRLAQQLRERIQNYAMDEILKILSEIQQT